MLPGYTKGMQNIRQKIKRLLRSAGPGIITGAADNDPSGIATYSQSGARFGYAQLWTIILMLPMMIAVQEMCARIGLVNGKGIAGVVKQYYSKWLLNTVVLLILVANTINLGTDLGAMAEATRLIFPASYTMLTVFYALFSIALVILSSYEIYSRYLKLLAFSLFAYLITGIIVSGSWSRILYSAIVPHIEYNTEFLLLLVGLFGTTISPYMFFWQASQEVEEELRRGLLSSDLDHALCEPVRRPVRFRRCGPLPYIHPGEIRDMRIDTWTGMIFSQSAAWFIIVTTAGTLHTAGVEDINSAAQAAEALEPLVHSFPYAGKIAQLLFAAGIIGLGLMAIPIFAGSASYALADTFGWTQGLRNKLGEAPIFYAVMLISTLVGMLINFLGINPMRALIYTAVINGVAAVPLIFVILKISSNKDIMGAYTNGRWTNILGWATFIIMGVAAIGMLAAYGLS
jgi:Mn2+/Fe2+ NRAMP family transporter